MNCEECNNEGYVLQADYQHDVMMRVRCIPCLAHENMMRSLAENMTKVMINVSHHRLAQVISNSIVSLENRQPTPDFERLFALVSTKNKETLLHVLGVMA
tara:strand:- start:243 stop:542 length:300 start_codon:yes stop_codon:yes gene_type:complete